jgi:hypothetical protein
MRVMSSWYFSSAPSVSDQRGIERDRVELHQSGGPVDGLGDAGRLEQIRLRSACTKRRPAATAWREPGAARLEDGELAVGVGIIDPVIEAAPLQRVMDLAGAVGGDDDDRRLGGLDRAEFGDRHLEIRQNFEQERLECLVGAVELVDQQDRRAADAAPAPAAADA